MTQSLQDAFNRWVVDGLPVMACVDTDHLPVPTTWPWRLLCGCLLECDEPLPDDLVTMLSMPEDATFASASLGLLRRGHDPGLGRWQTIELRDRPMMWRDMHEPQPVWGEWQFFDTELPTVALEQRRDARAA